jgi:hypothetical protein
VLGKIKIKYFYNQVHPGTIVYATDRFIGWSSLAPMWHQVDSLAADLLNISKAHPEGIHLVGKFHTMCYFSLL